MRDVGTPLARRKIRSVGTSVPMDNLLSISLHSECLSCACWSVNEDGAVLTIQKGVAQVASVDSLEHIRLRGLGIEHFLKRVDFAIALLANSLADHNLRL